MATSFDEFMQEIEAEAESEGPEAVAELEALHVHFALAREVARLRRARGLTQVELAARSGIAQSEISRIERGVANPTVATLAALSRPLEAILHLSDRVKHAEELSIA
ncbi:MAG: helix-turn-helix domain-containing protein [Thermoleophilaceae bacterium]|jgi:ribosome-binding protein aMBF1 (putative translation factor)